MPVRKNQLNVWLIKVLKIIKRASEYQIMCRRICGVKNESMYNKQALNTVSIQVCVLYLE